MCVRCVYLVQRFVHRLMWILMQPPTAMCTTHTLIERVQWSEMGLLGLHTEHTHSHSHGHDNNNYFVAIVRIERTKGLDAFGRTMMLGATHALHVSCIPTSIIEWGDRVLLYIYRFSSAKRFSRFLHSNARTLFKLRIIIPNFEHIYYGLRGMHAARFSFYLRCITWTIDEVFSCFGKFAEVVDAAMRGACINFIV